MSRILHLVPRFDRELEKRYLESRARHLAQTSLSLSLIYILPLLVFYGWDLLIDSKVGLATLWIRLGAAAITLGAAFAIRRAKGTDYVNTMITVMLLAAGFGFCLPLAVVQHGFSYGIAGLVVFIVVASFSVMGVRSAFSIYFPIATVTIALMLINNVPYYVFWSNALFILTGATAGTFCAYYFDQVSRYHFQVGEHLKTVATRDPLTKLSNRRAVYDSATKLLANPAMAGKPVSIMMMDIDHFKKINDTYGHDGGDDILKEVAAAILHATRQTDIVARWGGEEFIVILPNTRSEDALSFANRLCLRMRKNAIRTGDQLVPITISAGMTTNTVGAEDARALATLIGEADKALYFCKHNGRNQAAHFDNIPDEYQISNGPVTGTHVRREDIRGTPTPSLHSAHNAARA